MKLLPTLILSILSLTCSLNPSNPPLQPKITEKGAAVVLVLAAKNNDLEQASFALKNFPAVVNAYEAEIGSTTPPFEYKRWTAAHYAAFYGNVPFLKLLLRYNANFRKNDLSKRTPLTIACEEGQLEAVQFIISLTTYPLAKEGENSLLDLTISARARAQEELKKLANYLPSLGEKIKKTKLEEQATTEIVKKLILGKQAAEFMHSFSEKQKEVAELKKKIKNYTLIIILLRQLLTELGEEYLAKKNITKAYVVVANGAKSFQETINISQKKLNEAFLKASSEGNLTKLKSLLKNGAQTSYSDEKGSALHRAAESGNTKLFTYLLSLKTINPWTRDSNGYTPLHLAARHGHLEIVKTLINRTDCPNFLDLQYQAEKTPLELAILFDKLNVVSLLVAHQPEALFIKNSCSNPPLFTAIAKGHSKIVSHLIKTNPLLLQQQSFKGDNIFEHAAKHNQLAIFKLLEQKLLETNIYSVKFNSMKLLKIAAANGDSNFMAYLIQKNQVLERECLDSFTMAALKTVLDKAKKAKNTEVIKFLSQLYTSTTLLYQAVKEKNSTMLKKALAEGANPNCENSITAKTPLIQAIESNFFEGAEILLESGASPTQFVEGGGSPLSVALKKEPINSAFIELLLRYGARLDTIESLTQTCWRNFVKNADEQTVKLFKQYDLIKTAYKALFSDGYSLLGLAAQYDNLPAAKALIEAGFDPNEKNAWGKSPFYYARSVAMVELLIKAGASPISQIERGKRELLNKIKKSISFDGVFNNLKDALRTTDLIEYLIEGPCNFKSKEYKSMASFIFDTILEQRDNSLDLPSQAKLLKKLVRQGFSKGLDSAIKNGNKELITLLLENGAKITTSSLEKAALYKEDTSILPLLLSYQEDNPEELKKLIPKSIKNKESSFATISLLLERFQLKKTFLYEAIKSGNIKLVNLLIKNSTDQKTILELATSFAKLRWGICSDMYLSIKQQFSPLKIETGFCSAILGIKNFLKNNMASSSAWAGGMPGFKQNI